jgi:hypothetical protein
MNRPVLVASIFVTVWLCAMYVYALLLRTNTHVCNVV